MGTNKKSSKIAEIAEKVVAFPAEAKRVHKVRPSWGQSVSSQ
jgi:hypothetical protein